MDNPHEIMSTLEGTVERLKVIYDKGGRSPLDDGVAEVRQLCISVEEVLRHQQKDKLSFWGERRDYWHYLSEGVSKVKSFESCLKQVQRLTQFTTSQGKGRALIRECLVQQLLADCIQNCLSNQKRTKEWYHPAAIMLTGSFTQRLLTALYDLSNVTFDLPREGLELDETWPAFVVKSFRNQNGIADVSNTSGHLSPLQKVLGGSTQVAKVAEKQSLKVQMLEKAVEEEPSEIYVRREIPFDLQLVGTLLTDIRDCIKMGGDPAHRLVEEGPLPELKVTKLDDVTSGLTVLKSFVATWTQEVARKGAELKQENKSLKDRQADLEMQVQETMLESDSSETDLVRQLQDTRDEVRSVYNELQRLTSENEELNMLLCGNNEKIKELEDMNFNLEEQLVRCETETNGERQRTYSVLEFSLQEKEQNLGELTVQLEQSESGNRQLLQDLADSRTKLENQMFVIEEHQKNEDKNRKLEDSVRDLEELQRDLERTMSELKSQNLSLVSDLEEQRRRMENETKEKLELESKKWVSVERERDRLKAESDEVHSSVENEMSALKFKLSSINIELQQTKEHNSKKDRAIGELRNQTRNLESQISEARERAEEAEKEMEELKLEVTDIEGVLANQQNEMTSLHEQLTEKSLSRDHERAAMLKEQTLWDSQCQRLEIINAELKKQIDSLTSENDDLKKQFKKLLEQKVTLWQHADDLEQDHIAMGTWVDSKAVLECMNCNIPFSIFARKHHCRACGKVLCAKCCENKIQLAISKDPARVCDTCSDRIVKRRTPFASEYINQSLLDSTVESLTITGRRPRSNATLSPDMDDVVLRSPGRGSSGSATPTHRIGGGSSNSRNIERTIDLSGNSLQAKLLIQNHTPDMGSNSSSQQGSSSNIELEYSSENDTDITSTSETYKVPSKTTISSESTIPSYSAEGHAQLLDENSQSVEVQAEFQDASFRSVSSMEYSVDPELRLREAERLRQQQQGLPSNADSTSSNCDNYTVRAVQGATIDEDYYLIEPEDTLVCGGKDCGTNLVNPREILGSLDVGALASKLQLLEHTAATDKEGGMGQRRRGSSMGTGLDCGELKKVEIKEGGAHLVKLSIEKAGTAMAWEFRTEPKGIAFGICYKENVGSREEEVLPQKRCMSHKFSLNGDYSAQKKGIYILKFDNCHSKYTGRTLYYKVWTKAPN